jgi:integrase
LQLAGICLICAATRTEAPLDTPLDTLDTEGTDTMAAITTAEARAKLAVRRAPYFKEIERGELHLGYRRCVGVGTWVARRTLGKRERIAGTDQWTPSRYETRVIGDADDKRSPAGALDYDQAKAKAKQWLRQQAAVNGAKPITVKDAVEAYIAKREAKERAQKGGGGGLKRDATHRLTRHALADARLSGTPLERLGAEDLTKWRASLADKAALGRGKALSSTAIRRTVNDLKAALNAALELNHKHLPAELALVIKRGLKAPEITETNGSGARQAQVLPDADVRRILSSAADIDREGNWSGDLHRLILVMAATGARFSQVIRMTVADVQVAQSRLMVPVSHKGRGGKAVASTAVRVGADIIDRLRPVLVGRKGHEPLLLRPRWRQIKATEWELIGRAPWQSASELVRPWSKIVAKAELAADLVPYCLRHSSIVRGLRAGLPLRLVAALHDTSSTMIERHYAAYVVDAMDELAAKAVVQLDTPTVTPLAKAVSWRHGRA